MSRSKEKPYFRVRALTHREQLEKIRIWDYVDNVEHCIDLVDNSIHLVPTESLGKYPNYVSLEHIEGGLEYVYGVKMSHK